MDVPVEATILLDQFQNKTEVLEVLRSHGFQLTDLGGGQVHVRGYFFKLKAAKVRLEQLIEQQTNKTTLGSPSPSSGAISKYYNRDNRGRARSRDKPPHASPSSPSSAAAGSKDNRPTSQEYSAAASSSPPDQHASLRNGHETFVVDTDVFRYAERLRKRDIDAILNTYKVRIAVQENSSSSTITLQGSNSKSAVVELQKLLNNLNKSLRTQEVPLRDMDRNGKDLLGQIQRNNNVLDSVLVCEMKDRLHLIGPSSESYKVKQRLLGRQMNPTGRTGRTYDRNSRTRSSSLPPNSRKNTARESSTNPPPGGAAGFSPSKNQKDKHGAPAANPDSGGSRTRSQSESRMKKESDRAHDIVLETQNQVVPSRRNIFQQMLRLKFIPQSIKQKFKREKKKKDK